MSLPVRPVRDTGLSVSVLGFGAVPLGGLFSEVSDAQARATVDAALKAGITYFDTAPLYGHGLAEHRLGEALRSLPRDGFVLSTKVGRLLTPEPREGSRSELFAAPLPFSFHYDYSADGARRSLEDSLQRMGLARIDMLLIHDVVTRWHGDLFEQRYREAMDGAYRALFRMREEGVVRAIGVGIKDAEVCARFARDGDFDAIMLAGQYTLLSHDALDEFLPLAEARRIAVLLAAPFNSGILASGAVPGARYFYQPAPEPVLERVRRIEAVCRDHRVPLPAAAIQFPLGHASVATVVVGARSPEEVRANAGHLHHPIPAAFWDDLKAQGLLPAHAPIPERIAP